MKIINLIQGTSEWHAHRASHFNASDAPAMMGCSPHKTRTQLLHEKHTGLVPEVDAATQRRFDDGHRFEALARPAAEDIIGEELYPVTGSEDCLSASFDGLTMMESVAWEHKGLNETLRTCMAKNVVCHIGKDEFPLMYRVQMEQQLAVSGAEKVLFSATTWDANDNLLDERHGWYYPDLELRAQIIAGWEQFEIDLAAYTPTEVAQAAVAAPVMALPAVSVQVNGQLVVISNLDVFEVAVRAYINNLPTKPATDQEFADADAGCKAMSRAEDALAQVKAQTLGQVASVDTVVRTADLLADLCRTTRLSLEKLVKIRKEQIRGDIVAVAVEGFAEHISALNTRLGKAYMPIIQADFGGVIKGKKTVESLQNAVDTEMARAKIEANAIADKIQANLATLVKFGSDHKHLFHDTAQIVLKAPDDLEALVKTRVIDFMAAEGKRLEAEREKIRAEEVSKLEKAATDKANAALAAVPMIAAPVAVVAPVALAAKPPELLAIPPAACKTRPTDSQLIEVLALHFRVHESKVIEWLCDMDLSEASNAMLVTL